MDEELYEKVAGGLEEKGMEVVDEVKDDRSIIFKAVMRLFSKPLRPVNLLKVREDGETNTVIAVEKGSAKEEYKKLKEIRESVGRNCSLKIPEPYLLLEDEDIVVMEYFDRSVPEMLVLHNFFSGPSEEELFQAFRKLGQDLADLHNSTRTGEKIDIEKRIEQRILSSKEIWPAKLVKYAESMETGDITIPEAYVSKDIKLRHLKWDEDEIAIIDLAGFRHGNPLYSVFSFEHIMSNRESPFLRLDMKRLSKIFVNSYLESSNLNLDEYGANITRLDVLTEKMKSKERRLEDKAYRNRVKKILNKLESS